MIDLLRQLLLDNADKIPFFMANAGASRVHVSTQRLFEAAIIGAVLAGIGYIALIPRLEERMTMEIKQVRSDISELKLKVESIDAQRDRDYRELSREMRQQSDRR